MSAADKIVQLRAMMKAKFPEAHAVRQRVRESIGIDSLDAIGAQRGCLTECVAPLGSGGAVLTHRIIREVVHASGLMALVDSKDSFEPCRATAHLYRGRLLWVRCRTLTQTFQALDLLLRDGNVPIILADFLLQPMADLRGQAESTWLRLRALAEQNTLVLLVLTPQPTVACAQHRIELRWELSLSSLDSPELLMTQEIPMRLLSERGASGGRSEQFRSRLCS